MSFSVNSPVTIIFFPEPWENRLFGLIDRITIIIDSNTITVPFTVPTGDFDPENGTPAFFEAWIQRIQGALLSSTGITEEEHEKLLHFALGYRAFYLNRDDIPVDDYYAFVGQLVADTLALRPPESTADALEAAVEWLLGHLPADIFDDPGIEIPQVMPYAEVHDPQITATLANASTDFSPTGALIEMCPYLVPARTSYSARASPGTRTGVRAGHWSILNIPLSAISTEYSSDEDDEVLWL
ncbi:hypothetical protein LXA43DRAFT_1066609 [Ganoderma leucocontextum]|nr:hypothetical protein LXA43DRAFT_1066609 [Ganoderma leucocontextum]